MSDTTDIRKCENQLEEFMKILLEKIASEEKTIRFVLASKFKSCLEFSIDIFSPVSLSPKDFKHRIICSIDYADLKRHLQAGRFRLDDFEVYPSDPIMLYYTATYFK